MKVPAIFEMEDGEANGMVHVYCSEACLIAVMANLPNGFGLTSTSDVQCDEDICESCGKRLLPAADKPPVARTPGHWYVHVRHDGIVMVLPSEAPESLSIANMTDYGGMPAKENAEFIARACNNFDALLAALKRLYGWKHCIQSPDPYEELDGDLQAAEDAIAKAEEAIQP